MSTTTSTGRTVAAPSGTEGRGRSITLWVLQVLLAVAFAAGGLLKLGGTHQMVDLFTKIGAGQWFRYLIGTFEMAAAAGVLIPLLSGLAALGLTALMAGASVTNAFIIHTSPVVPLAFLVVSAVVARGRWPQTKALATNLRR